MKYLQRPLPAPNCLSNCNYNIHKWSGPNRKPNSDGRKAIWKKLTKMQGGFCCYCESIAEKGNGHIEHFFYKGKKEADVSAPYKHLTFDWNNLFGCCGLHSRDTCGHYKDRPGDSGPGYYDPNHLIKPDVDNPSDFFEFLPTGVINVKPGLSPTDDNKAKETLRVLNLGALNGARKRLIDIFKEEVDTLYQLESDTQILIQEIDKIKQRIKHSEFQTAIWNVLF
jgi:uncharacterized protein (TIGR02646 family)